MRANPPIVVVEVWSDKHGGNMAVPRKAHIYGMTQSLTTITLPPLKKSGNSLVIDSTLYGNNT